jgi:hypothetical protein
MSALEEFNAPRPRRDYYLFCHSTDPGSPSRRGGAGRLRASRERARAVKNGARVLASACLREGARCACDCAATRRVHSETGDVVSNRVRLSDLGLDAIFAKSVGRRAYYGTSRRVGKQFGTLHLPRSQSARAPPSNNLQCDKKRHLERLGGIRRRPRAHGVGPKRRSRGDIRFSHATPEQCARASEITSRAGEERTSRAVTARGRTAERIQRRGRR